MVDSTSLLAGLKLSYNLRVPENEMKLIDSTGKTTLIRLMSIFI